MKFSCWKEVDDGIFDLSISGSDEKKYAQPPVFSYFLVIFFNFFFLIIKDSILLLFIWIGIRIQLHGPIHPSLSHFFFLNFFIFTFLLFLTLGKNLVTAKMVAKVIQEKIKPMHTSRLPMAMGSLLLYVD